MNNIFNSQVGFIEHWQKHQVAFLVLIVVTILQSVVRYTVHTNHKSIILSLQVHMLDTFGLQASFSLHNPRIFSRVHSSASVHAQILARRLPFYCVVHSWLLEENVVHCCDQNAVMLKTKTNTSWNNDKSMSKLLEASFIHNPLEKRRMIRLRSLTSKQEQILHAYEIFQISVNIF